MNNGFLGSSIDNQMDRQKEALFAKTEALLVGLGADSPEKKAQSEAVDEVVHLRLRNAALVYSNDAWKKEVDKLRASLKFLHDKKIGG